MKKTTAILSVMLAGSLWGIISIFINALADAGFTGMDICFLRMVTCAAMMFVLLVCFKRELLKIRLRDIWMFIGTGIISLTLFSYCYFTTIINVEASIAVSLLYTSPIFVMLFSALLFKENVNLRKLAAIILTVAGCALVSGIAGNSTKMGAGAFLVGIGAGLFYALYSVFGRYATEKYHPFTITFYTFVFASIGFCFISRPAQAFGALAARPDMLGTVLISGIITGILPYVFYTTGLKYLNPSEAGVLVAVEPLVGCIVGISVFHESANPLKILGIVLILSSIVILSVEPKKGHFFLKMKTLLKK